MTVTPFISFNTHAPVASSSAVKSKRKRMSWGLEEEEAAKHIRIRSPPLVHRSSFPLPELMTDHSNSASDDDQAMGGDTDMDGDMDMDAPIQHHSPIHQRSPPQGHPGLGEYMFGSGGSGGFGFGPGAEEDEEGMDMMDDMGAGYMKSVYPASSLYPSLTPHTNPHHFSNSPPPCQAPLAARSQGQGHTGTDPIFGTRATSPLAAQPFSTTLPAPRPVGLLQPAVSAPLAADASDVEKARAQHGPTCKSIPKLVLSEYPDTVTGRRSMWSICGDCGACEMAV